jgi:hypothetical protein
VPQLRPPIEAETVVLPEPALMLPGVAAVLEGTAQLWP